MNWLTVDLTAIFITAIGGVIALAKISARVKVHDEAGYITKEEHDLIQTACQIQVKSDMQECHHELDSSIAKVDSRSEQMAKDISDIKGSVDRLADEFSNASKFLAILAEERKQ